MINKKRNLSAAIKVNQKALVICSLLASIFVISGCSPSPQTLSNDQQMSINTQAITVSGLSSGAYMASQFHLSHAEIVTGAGLIAAGPYNCARGDINVVFAECLGEAPETYDSALFTPFDTNIAAASELQDDRVWIFHGTLDERIHGNAAAALYSQYKQWLSPQNQENNDRLEFLNNMPAAHLFPTMNKGSQCDTSESPFIGNCDFDAAGLMLQHIVGSTLNPRVDDEALASKGQLMRFTQDELSDVSGANLADEGFVYIPDACKNSKTCDLHISFHGCNQAIANVNDAYAKDTGLNNWAATNNIIVLYPQIEASNIMPMNPQGCWDWWGYTDENYANKDGKQIRAIHSMVKNLPQFLSQFTTSDSNIK